MQRSALLICLAALPCAYACGSGGTITTNPLHPDDPAPSSVDSPPSSTDPPPANNDTPVSSSDPVPDSGASGGGTCVPCSASYTCGTGSTAVSATFDTNQGMCEGKVAGMSASIGGDRLCGTVVVPGGSLTVNANGTLTACADDAGAAACIDCVAGPSLSGGVTSVDASVTIGSGGCAELMTCCGTLSGVEATDCQAVAKVGNADECTEYLTVAGCS